MTQIYVKGLNGQVEVDDEWVRIHREGLNAHMAHGAAGFFTGLIGRAGVEIELVDIVDIEISYPRVMTRGYIRFLTSLQEPIGPIAAIKDETSVLFMKHHQDDFRQLRKDVLTLAGVRGTPEPAPVSDIDFVAQLRELGQLRAEGILNDAEFNSAKARVLGGGSGISIARSSTGQRQGRPGSPDWAGLEGRCTKCGAIPKAEATACWYCGTPATRHLPPPTERRCANPDCRKPLAEGNPTCWHCGTVAPA